MLRIYPLQSGPVKRTSKHFLFIQQDAGARIDVVTITTEPQQKEEDLPIIYFGTPVTMDFPNLLIQRNLYQITNMNFLIQTGSKGTFNFNSNNNPSNCIVTKVYPPRQIEGKILLVVDISYNDGSQAQIDITDTFFSVLPNT